MNKVVINKCYGGYGLSKKAAQWLIDHNISKDYYIKEYSEDSNFIHNYLSWNVPRHHPLLVQCVEELERDAYGDFAWLEIVEIDSDLYRINDYDGMESVETPNDICWINTNE